MTLSNRKDLLAAQLTLAKECDLPLVLHANKAVEDVILEIRKSGAGRGVVHSFNGSLQQAERLVGLGYKLSFGGALTYSRATRLRSLVRKLPLETLMLETDAPDQSPAKYYAERNQPAYLQEVFQTFCELRNESAKTIAKQLNQNAIDLFNLPLTEAQERLLQQVETRS